jgi:hypothetical protein
MTERAPLDVTNLDRYGDPELPWSRPRDLLEAGPPGPEITFFLGTVGTDGRPHAAGVGALWAAGVEGDAFTAPFSAPSAGPPPWNLYYFTLRTAFGVASAEPHGATRWRFG